MEALEESGECFAGLMVLSTAATLMTSWAMLAQISFSTIFSDISFQR
jgi:hypothetical protein